MECRRIVPVIVVALLVPRLAGAAANKEHLQLMAEVRMLQEQQQQLQGLLGALQDTLKAVTVKLDDQANTTRKAMADQTLATTNIGDNVRVLREKTDETNVRISTMAQQVEALRQTLASQPSAPAGTLPSGGPDPAAAAGMGAPSQPAPPPISGASMQRMYETSYDDYTAGRYDLAIQGFQGFVQAFPRMPQAANAEYNIGMSYYNLSKWNDARDAFQLVTANYPQASGTVVADAYYKLGQTYERLNQIDNARKAYDAAVQKAPGTQTAALASTALQRLNRR